MQTKSVSAPSAHVVDDPQSTAEYAVKALLVRVVAHTLGCPPARLAAFSIEELRAFLRVEARRGW